MWLSKEETTLFTGDWGDSVIVWDVSTRERKATMKADGTVRLLSTSSRLSAFSSRTSGLARPRAHHGSARVVVLLRISHRLRWWRAVFAPRVGRTRFPFAHSCLASVSQSVCRFSTSFSRV